jgi:hypothetical protein
LKRITREIKQKTQALTFNVISGFHLIEGFKAEVTARLMKKECQLTTITMIKTEAMQIDLILEEKKKKSTIGKFCQLVLTLIFSFVLYYFGLTAYTFIV